MLLAISKNRVKFNLNHMHPASLITPRFYITYYLHSGKISLKEASAYEVGCSGTRIRL